MSHRYLEALDPHLSPSSAGRASPRLSHRPLGHRAVGQMDRPGQAEEQQKSRPELPAPRLTCRAAHLRLLQPAVPLTQTEG